MTRDSAPDFEGMTLLERLVSAGQLEAWDVAVAARDEAEVIRILARVAIADPARAAAAVLGSK